MKISTPGYISCEKFQASMLQGGSYWYSDNQSFGILGSLDTDHAYQKSKSTEQLQDAEYKLDDTNPFDGSFMSRVDCLCVGLSIWQDQVAVWMPVEVEQRAFRLGLGLGFWLGGGFCPASSGNSLWIEFRLRRVSVGLPRGLIHVRLVGAAHGDEAAIKIEGQ